MYRHEILNCHDALYTKKAGKISDNAQNAKSMMPQDAFIINKDALQSTLSMRAADGAGRGRNVVQSSHKRFVTQRAPHLNAIEQL